MALHQTLRFSNSNPDFFTTVTKRVNEYFKSNGISRHANTEMVVKTIFMFSLYFIPYACIVSGAFLNPLILLLFCILMGLGTAGIGLSIMHDANHNSYSSKAWVNETIGYALNLIGGNAFTWKVQHNVLHHTFTNIHDADEDISPRGVLRMCPKSTWKPVHRYQHIYAWPLYGLLTFVWTCIQRLWPNHSLPERRSCRENENQLRKGMDDLNFFKGDLLHLYIDHPRAYITICLVLDLCRILYHAFYLRLHSGDYFPTCPCH